MVIAIDGPAGAGKSSVSRAVAERLGLRYLDTGAMYRALGLAVLDRGLDPSDPSAVDTIAGSVDLRLEGGVVLVDGVDVSDRIRTPAATRAAARVAQHGRAREALVDIQREAAAKGGVVMEGRDIGTTVVPDADLKVFLTASLQERAQRRCRQLGEEETPERMAELEASIEARDEADRTREASPLVQADDAIVIDTTGLSQEEVIGRITALAAERRG